MKSKLQAIEERASKATKGPWQDDKHGNDVVDENFASVAKTLSNYFTTQERDNNRAFIAHSREDIELLLEVAKKSIIASESNALNANHFLKCDCAACELDRAVSELSQPEEQT